MKKFYLSLSLIIQVMISFGQTAKDTTIKLKEVTVTYTRPGVEKQTGKTVINVSGTISAAGSTALEILQRSPGVSVNENGAIRLNGRSGVQVMIDGKVQPVSGDDLAQLLKSLPASTIDKIDLNTNPSAKYDAGGNAGIIDIRTKKEQRAGIYGNVTGSLSQAKFLKGTTGGSLNYRAGRLSFATSYNYTNRRDFMTLELDRRFFKGENPSGAQDQINEFKTPVQVHNAQASMNYQLFKSTSVGIGGGFYTNDNTRMLNNRTASFEQGSVYTGYSLTEGNSDYHRRNPSLNVNLKQKLGTGSLIADFDYAYYGTENDQLNHTMYLKPDNSSAKMPYDQYGDLSGAVTIRTAKADYSGPAKGWVNKVDAGWKSSWVKSDNNVAFFDRSTGGNIALPTISNHFLYHENINAAYVSLQKSGDRLSASLGLRLENTNTSGRQLVGDFNNNRSYTQVFPNLSFSYQLSKMQTVGLSFSRRIDRPTYRQLNPFRYYFNENTYIVGNPNLKPQLTHVMELSHTIADKYIFTYTYSRTTDNMLGVAAPDPALPGVVVQTDRNLAVLNYYSMSFSAPIAIGSWFKSYNSLLTYYNQFKGDLVNTRLDNGKVTLHLNTSNTFIITPTLSAELTGTYITSERDGFLTTRPNGMLGAGLQKHFLHKAASIKLSVIDIFQTGKVRGGNPTQRLRGILKTE